MTDFEKLAEALFPENNIQTDSLETKYPPRDLPDGAMVTRYAPSPTGFIHIGALYAAMISERFAHQGNGVFYLRIEDTDQKREIAEGAAQIVKAMSDFGINIDEGMDTIEKEKGAYGPYKQSARFDIYQAYVKLLVSRGQAYPCFCTPEELDNVREKQQNEKLKTGYYGEWAVCRNIPAETAAARVKAREPWIVRLKSPGDPQKRIAYKDLIKGKIELFENDQDIVIIKSDGLPTYHFAHLVDDRLMRTTHVIRGDEWLSSVPVHLQLFSIMGWKPPMYGHIAPIVKEEGKSRRKLSKRKDPEAAVSFYHEQGYPDSSIREYLLNLANSSFEDWRKANPRVSWESFKLEFSKMSQSGALFDIQKLNDISKNVIAFLDADDVYAKVLAWAHEYNLSLAALLERDPAYAKKIFNIDRGGDKPRKDIAKWSDVPAYIEYFYDDLIDAAHRLKYEFPDNFSAGDIRMVLEKYPEVYSPADDKNQWFEKIRDMAEPLGFCRDMKVYKASPEKYKGHAGDLSTIIRVALTGRKNTPDLYEILQVMGTGKIRERFKSCIDCISTQR